MARCKILLLVLIFSLCAGQAFAWKSQRLGVSFIPPSGWAEKSYVGEHVVALYAAPKSPGARSVVSLAVVALHPDTDKKATLDDKCIDEIISHSSQKISSYKLLGRKFCTLYGIKAARIGFVAKHDGHKMRATQILCVNNNNLYVFTLNTDAELHQDALPEFEKMLDNVRFLD